MKKLLVILMTAIMVMTFSVPAAFAAEGETGSITINGVSADNTYEIYKLLDLESYDSKSGAYSYTANEKWTGFFATEEAQKYIEFEAGYAKWVNGDDDDSVAAFAKAALAYAKDNGIGPVKSSKNEGEFVISGTTGKFSGLELGYYLVDSSVGALCGLTTTNPDASINAKNGVPTIDKQVEEDSTKQWTETNTADIGQVVNFRVTINVHAGAENYVLHDEMSEGLDFKGVTEVKHVVPGVDEHIADAAMYKVVTDGLTDGCTFEIRFSEEFCEELETNDKIIVFYSAILNKEAIVAEDGNPNETWLDYGEENESNHDTTQTYTFGIDLVKTDSQNTLIDGAEFKIYNAATDGKEVGVVLMDDGVTYRRASENEQNDGKTVPIVVKDGQVRVVGFDNGTYYLEETKAPEGYNKLTARQKFIISDANLDAVYNNGVFSSGSGVHVVNKTGSMLPETGGIGTTIFVLIGGILVVGAGVILFARRRNSQYE